MNGRKSKQHRREAYGDMSLKVRPQVARMEERVPGAGLPGSIRVTQTVLNTGARKHYRELKRGARV